MMKNRKNRVTQACFVSILLCTNLSFTLLGCSHARKPASAPVVDQETPQEHPSEYSLKSAFKPHEYIITTKVSAIEAKVRELLLAHDLVKLKRISPTQFLASFAHPLATLDIGIFRDGEGMLEAIQPNYTYKTNHRAPGLRHHHR